MELENYENVKKEQNLSHIDVNTSKIFSTFKTTTSTWKILPYLKSNFFSCFISFIFLSLFISSQSLELELSSWQFTYADFNFNIYAFTYKHTVKIMNDTKEIEFIFRLQNQNYITPEIIPADFDQVISVDGTNYTITWS